MSSPELFAFTPAGGRIESSAFSTPFKVLAAALIAPALVWGWQLWSTGTIALTLSSSGWLFAALCLMVYTSWYIFNGKTILDNTTLEQTWVWHKRAELRQLAYVKLIRMRGLEWLVAPRLYTKTYAGKLAIFYASSPAMLAEFERMESELKALRIRR
jgi:hypothetical protein